jgi:hypothetical protein
MTVHDIPGSARSLSSLVAIDYGDRFSVATDASATAEQWARAMFGNTPSAGEVLIWRVLLGFRLDRRRSPDTVAGWRVGERHDDWVRLETASWFLSANLIVRTAPGRVSLSTFLHYDRRLGRVLWPPLSTVHRRLVPGVLRSADTRIRVRPRNHGGDVRGGDG